MPSSTECPKCGAMVYYDVPDEEICAKCGWSGPAEAERDYREWVRERCEDHGFDYRSLVREFGGVEFVDSYLAALEKDD
jgi:hypothetical protein